MFECEQVDARKERAVTVFSAIVFDNVFPNNAVLLMLSCRLLTV